MKWLFVAACMLAVASCAKKPENIAAIDVGGDAYSRHSCAQLKADKLTIQQGLDQASAKQKDAASGDAVGVLLLGLPLSSMSGNDQETVIAVAKGKIQAIDRQALRKGCK